MKYPRMLVALGAFVFVCAASAELASLPRMSLTAGSPCSTCHETSQGGDIRSEIGWGTGSQIGMVDYEQLGIDWLAEKYTNRLQDAPIAVGLDVRLQVARLGRPSTETAEDGNPQVVMPDRRVFPMQVQPHLLVELTDYLRLHGSYAAGPKVFQGERLCDTTFAGQSCFMAQAIVEPSPPWPTVRVGMLQPSIGIRHDDHTMLIRHDASRSASALIPINYADPGVEATYQPAHWLRFEGGGFVALNLADSIADEEVVSSGDAAYLGRVSLMPRFEVGDEWSFYGIFGGSAFGAGEFQMQNAFAGIGLLDRASLIMEGARFSRGESATGLNLASILSVELKEWLVAEGRLERGRASTGSRDFQTNAAVLGLQYFPIPFVELRPEYRYTDADAYAMGQYTAQLHLFY